MIKLYPHQAEEVLRHGLESHRALLWCPRSGKTLTALHTMIRQSREGGVRRVLVTTPPGVVDHWVSEAQRCGLRAWRWDSRRNPKTQMKDFSSVLEEPGLTVYVVGSQVWAMDRAALMFRKIAQKGGVGLIVDESHEYARPSSKRSRRVRSFARHTTSARLLTGTPLHNRLLDAWAQYEILSPECLGYRRYGDFCDRYGVYQPRRGPHGTWQQLVGYRHVLELMKKISSYSSVIAAKDLPSMPAVRRLLATSKLEKSTWRVYRALLDGISEENAAVRLLRMQQIVAHDSLRCAETVRRALRADGKAVVWVRFNNDLFVLRQVAVRTTSICTTLALRKRLESRCERDFVRVGKAVYYLRSRRLAE